MDCRWEWRNLKHSVTNRSERSSNPLLMRHLMSRRIHYRYINLFFDLFEVAFPDWHQILHNHTLYQTLVLFLVAKTSADNLSQGFRTELPLTYRLLSPRPSLPISFPCWPPPCFFFLDHLPALVSLYTAPQQEDGSCSSPAFVSGWRLTEHQRQIPQLRLSRERER